MTQDHTPRPEAIDVMLTSLISELDALMDLAVLPPAPTRFGPLLTRCINATALAKASQTLNARALAERTLPQQIAGGDLERNGEPLQDGHGRIAHAALHA